MSSGEFLKTLKDLIDQTPLIIDPQRDGPRFQNALAGLPTPKLQAFYSQLSHEERRRFHYAANICLGYESWCGLYKDLVVQETQARLADRMETVYAGKEAELRQREASLEKERRLWEGENQELLAENQQLRAQIAELRQAQGLLQEQQAHLQHLVANYQALIKEYRALMTPSSPSASAEP